MTAVARARASDRGRWDALVVGRAGTITQSWGHGEFVRRGGWPIDRFIATGSHGETVGALLVLYRPVALLTIAYAPRGPVLSSPEDDLETLEAVLTVARRAARRHRAVTLFLDPAWPAGHPGVNRVLRRARIQPTSQETMHRCTWVVGLEGGAAATLARMGPSVRRMIRIASRGGVDVAVRHDAAALAVLHALYTATLRRAGISGVSLDELRLMVECWSASAAVAVIVASVDGAPVRAMLAAAAGPRLCFIYGGGTQQHGDLQPAYAMHWRAITWGIEHGCVEYDMWGVPCDEREADSTGYSHFKRRWRGELERLTPSLQRTVWPAPAQAERGVARLLLRGRGVLE